MSALQNMKRFLSLPKTHKQLMGYLNKLAYAHEVNEGSKSIIKIEFESVTKHELISVAQDLLKIFSTKIVDLSAVYNSNPDISILNSITISLKGKLPLIHNSNQTKTKIDYLTEYSVSIKYGGTDYNESGGIILYTNVGEYFLYKKI